LQLLHTRIRSSSLHVASVYCFRPFSSPHAAHFCSFASSGGPGRFNEACIWAWNASRLAIAAAFGMLMVGQGGSSASYYDCTGY
jgi:hypothetical protein